MKYKLDFSISYHIDITMGYSVFIEICEIIYFFFVGLARHLHKVRCCNAE